MAAEVIDRLPREGDVITTSYESCSYIVLAITECTERYNPTADVKGCPHRPRCRLYCWSAAIPKGIREYSLHMARADDKGRRARYYINNVRLENGRWITYQDDEVFLVSEADHQLVLPMLSDVAQ